MTPILFTSPMPPSSYLPLTFEQGLEDGHIHILLAIFALSENGQEMLAPHYVLDLQGKPWARQSAATSPPCYFQQPPVNPCPCSLWVSCRSPVLSPSPARVGATRSFSAQSEQAVEGQSLSPAVSTGTMLSMAGKRWMFSRT